MKSIPCMKKLSVLLVGNWAHPNTLYVPYMDKKDGEWVLRNRNGDNGTSHNNEENYNNNN